ncbi:cobalt-precorrin-6A reductase [Rhodoligotrophos defluvii]|uniref:cobalt-precorrin-6A reductase n=1 Tax=Rhodoligotrophos defluvii TaxID=2561934 RepID=UPI0010C94D73|nr:cobalt-precorrin-6A reductase [Rhodoligotrophos defluvii]
MKVLILGGTSEAAALARLLAGEHRLDALLSLAGATKAPAAQPLPTRIGGFGGSAGLARFLREERFALVVDATHPFATTMSANARAACNQTGVPLIAIRRLAWTPQPGDAWQQVANLEAAIAALGEAPRRVFLTTGRKEVAIARHAPQHHYLIRSVDPPPPETLPPRATVLLSRGPFEVDAERALLREHQIEVVVTKNAGGEATRAKLDAARALGLPVIMVERPPKPRADVEVASAAEAYAWLAAHVTGSLTERGV